MSTETASLVCGAVALGCGAAMSVAIFKRNAAGIVFGGLFGGVALAVCFGMGHEVRSQVSRDAARQARRQRLLEAFPLESLDDRLPRRLSPATVDVVLSSEASADLDLTEKATDLRGRRRQELLQGLHEGTVEVFSEEVGQGYGRMPYVTKKVLDELARADANPQQPEITGSPDVPQPSAGEGPVLASLKVLHRLGVEEFANAQDFGFVTRDGKQMAGFIPHRFTAPVKVDPRRRLKRFDLVGLLMHDEPVVYVSDKLPRMNELKTVPTRALDAFEASAVQVLRGGEAVVIRDDAHGTRMVGAVRAAKQCLTCHETRRGELLGAFTYRFERL